MIEVTPQERDAIFRQDFIAFFLKAFWAAHQGIVEDRHGAKPNRSLRTVDGASDRPE